MSKSFMESYRQFYMIKRIAKATSDIVIFDHIFPGILIYKGEIVDPFEKEIRVVAGGYEHRLRPGMREFIKEHEEEICNEITTSPSFFS